MKPYFRFMVIRVMVIRVRENVGGCAGGDDDDANAMGGMLDDAYSGAGSDRGSVFGVVDA